MKHLAITLACLLIAACAPQFEDMDVAEFKPQDGMLLVNYEYVFDGSSESNCHMFFDTSQKDLEVAGLLNTQTKLILVPGGGKVSLTSVQCLSYNVLFNKVRKKTLLPPLNVYVEPGTITYPGTLMANWDSEDVHLADILLNGSGGLGEDDGALLMKLDNRPQRMLQLLQSENPALLEKFTLVQGRYDDNPYLVQPKAPEPVVPEPEATTPQETPTIFAPSVPEKFFAPTPSIDEPMSSAP